MNTFMTRFFATIVALYMALFIVGCTYHKYYETPEGPAELKDSHTVSKEKVVERHYVVE